MPSSSSFPLHLSLFLLACFSLLRFAFPVVALFVSWPPLSFVSWSYSQSRISVASRPCISVAYLGCALLGRVSVDVSAARLDRGRVRRLGRRLGCASRPCLDRRLGRHLGCASRPCLDRRLGRRLGCASRPCLDRRLGRRLGCVSRPLSRLSISAAPLGRISVVSRLYSQPQTRSCISVVHLGRASRLCHSGERDLHTTLLHLNPDAKAICHILSPFFTLPLASV